MYLKTDAKIISVLDIDTIRHIIISKHYDEFPESELFVFGDLPNNVNREIILNRGLMARILGFDALDCSGKCGEFDAIGDEMVVVNRASLVVCDEAVLA